MKRLRTYLVGIDQGSHTLFSDFQDDGPMWSGSGPRESRMKVDFSERFRDVPTVHLGISMWDTDGDTNQRADLRAEAVSETGFEIVFRTWGDSRVARIRADWIAVGEVIGEDDWDIS
jgi:hypothetical protein